MGALTHFSHIKPSPSKGKGERQRGKPAAESKRLSPNYTLNDTNPRGADPVQKGFSARGFRSSRDLGMPSSKTMGPSHFSCHQDAGMLPLPHPQPSRPGGSCRQPSPPHLWGLSLVVWGGFWFFGGFLVVLVLFFFTEDAPNQNQI